MNQDIVRLVNRTDKPYTFMFDGRGYTVPASSEAEEGSINVTRDCGQHAVVKSYMNYSLETGLATYQVGIEGTHDIDFVGSGKEKDEEVIDRKTDSEGIPSKLSVRGGVITPEREDAFSNRGE